MEMRLEPGMIFCSQSAGVIGKTINFFQKLNASDNNSEYSHSGIITSAFGDTFESLTTIRKSTLKPYTGKKILIGRNKNMTMELYQKGWAAVKPHEGQVYPYWRLPMQLIPWVGKMGRGNWPVCSELTCKFLAACDNMCFYWKGKCPDDIADMIIRWKAWDTVFEGVLE